MEKKKSKVLIVEDDKMIGSMYKIKLESDGFEIFLADNGATGLEIAKKEKPDIVMLDIILPQLDGFTVLEELKKDAKWRRWFPDGEKCGTSYIGGMNMPNEKRIRETLRCHMCGVEIDGKS